MLIVAVLLSIMCLMFPSNEGSAKGGVTIKTETPRSKKLRLELGGPCWLNSLVIRHLFALILLPSLAGCFARTDIRPYPETWTPVATVAARQCPDISGEYENFGDGEWNHWHCGTGKYPPKAAWNCDTSLAGNLVKMKAVDTSELSSARSVQRVKLQQPDPDTLEVYLSPEDSQPKIFKRSQGDFDCDSSSLKFSMTGSAFSSEESSTVRNITVATGVLALYAAVGIDSTERVFRPLQDGSLSMEATQSDWGTALVFFNFHTKFNGFVRWGRYRPSPEANVNPASP